MSTLDEIKTAVESLSDEEQKALGKFLFEQEVLRKSTRPWHPSGWPVAPPDVPMEELKRVHALIEEEFSRVES